MSNIHRYRSTPAPRLPAAVLPSPISSHSEPNPEPGSEGLPRGPSPARGKLDGHLIVSHVQVILTPAESARIREMAARTFAHSVGKLDLATQREVQAALEGHANDCPREDACLRVASASRYTSLPASVRSALLRLVAQDGDSRQFTAAVAGLAESEAFGALPPGQQDALVTAMGRRGMPWDARFALASLAVSSQLAVMRPALREKLIGYAVRDDHSANAGARAAQSTGFAALPPEQQDVLVSAMARAGASTNAQLSLASLAASPGLAGMRAELREQLLRYVTLDNPLSRLAAIKARVLSEEKISPAASAAKLEEFVIRQGGTPEQIGEALYELAPRFAPYQLTTPTRIPRATFERGTAEALEYTVRIGAQRVVVDVTTRPVEPGLHLPRIEEVAKALSALPPALLGRCKRVVVEPLRGKRDADFSSKFGWPEFRAYMTASHDGVIRIFPSLGPVSENELAWSLMHEFGHRLGQDLWGDRASKWEPWASAVAQDKCAPSVYATKPSKLADRLAEDLAESVSLYAAISGGPYEPSIRAMMPARFAILDKLPLTAK